VLTLVLTLALKLVLLLLPQLVVVLLLVLLVPTLELTLVVLASVGVLRVCVYFPLVPDVSPPPYAPVPGETAHSCRILLAASLIWPWLLFPYDCP